MLERTLSPRLRSTLVSMGCVLLAVALAWFIGRRIGTDTLGYRDLLLGGLVAAGGVLLLRRQGVVHFGLLLWIGLFAVGQRTIQLSNALVVHPLLLLLGLLVLLMLAGARRGGPTLRVGLPRLLLFVAPFWLWGWLTGLAAGTPLDVMANEALNVALLVPVFMLARTCLTTPGYWRALILTFCAVATLISVLGLLEYSVPDVARLFPDLVQASPISETSSFDNFQRARFAFWGGSHATFIPALALPLLLPLWSWQRSPAARLALLGAAAAMLVAVYIGGYRSLWAGVAGVFVLLMMRVGGGRGLLAALLGLAGLFALLPLAGQARFLTFLAALQGQFHDGSALDRWLRATGAISTALAQPWGVGWGGAGWVHSDFIQLAANLGLIAGALFVAAYGGGLRLVWRRVGGHTPLGLGLLGSGLLAGWLMLVNGVIVQIQAAAPLWLVWALLVVYQEQRAGAAEDGECPAPA